MSYIRFIKGGAAAVIAYALLYSIVFGAVFATVSVAAQKRKSLMMQVQQLQAGVAIKELDFEQLHGDIRQLTRDNHIVRFRFPLRGFTLRLQSVEGRLQKYELWSPDKRWEGPPLATEFAFSDSFRARAAVTLFIALPLLFNIFFILLLQVRKIRHVQLLMRFCEAGTFLLFILVLGRMGAL